MFIGNKLPQYELHFETKGPFKESPETTCLFFHIINHILFLIYCDSTESLRFLISLKNVFLVFVAAHVLINLP